MRKFLIALGSLSLVSGPVPAFAEGGGYGPGFGGSFATLGAGPQLRQLSRAVTRGVDRGALDARQAEDFRRQIDHLQAIDWRYGVAGYAGLSRRSVDERIVRLYVQVGKALGDVPSPDDWR